MAATDSDTKTRILDAAEQLFTEQGFEATSLRSLTTAAGVNLAAVNYHFGTKEELFQAVLTRRLDPMNQERIELLERVERQAGGKPATVEKVIFAMLIPALRIARDEAREELPARARARLRRPGAVHPALPLGAIRGDDRPLQGSVPAGAPAPVP